MRPIGRLLAALCASLLVACFTSAAQAHPRADENDVVRLFRAGQQDMQSGHFDRASEEFKAVLRLQPDLAEACFNLGLAYHAMGRYSEAIPELERAARQKPDLLPAQLFLGISYLKTGSPEKAIPPLRRVLSSDPSNREARRALATAELARADYSKAAADLRTLAATDTDRADAWFTLGRDYLDLAQHLLPQLAQRFHQSAWAHRMAGDVLADRRLWSDAAFEYRKALVAEPGEPGLHAALGQMLAREGKLDEASSEFRRELRRDPAQPEALMGLAAIALMRGDSQAALQATTKIWRSSPQRLLAATDFPQLDLPAEAARRMLPVVSAVPDDPPRQFILSALLRLAGDSDRSRQERLSFESSARSVITQNKRPITPSLLDCEHNHELQCVEFLRSKAQPDTRDLLLLGRTLLVLGHGEAASEALAGALAHSPGNPETIYWLSRAYLGLANTCFEQLTAAYPDSWRAHELKAESFHIREADKEAIDEYRAAERLNPDDPKIHEALGEILLAQRAPQEAKSELQQALAINAAAPRSLYLMGLFYLDDRNPVAAIPYLESAVRYDPTLLQARSALGKAYLRVGKPQLAVGQLERSTQMDRYGDLHFLLYQAYRGAGKPQLAARALAQSQELRRKSAADDQAKIRPVDQEPQAESADTPPRTSTR